MQASLSLQLPPVVAAQVPSAPGVLHAWHWPQTVIVQQTPSTQVPTEQSVVVLHRDPIPAPVTSMLNDTVDVLLRASVAEQVTVWRPTSKWPGAGVQVTRAGPLI